MFRIVESQKVDILVIDEIESILEKMYSCNNKMDILYSFINLYKNAGRVIVMDGLIEERTIEYLNIIRMTDNF